MFTEFRGKSIANDEWVYGSYTHLSDGEGNATIIPFGSNKFIAVHAETVGQFTGKLFCGQKVYTSDVIGDVEPVRGELGDVIDYESIAYIVVSMSESAGFALRPLVGEGHESLDGLLIIPTVIGNIWDNPNLLEGRESTPKEDTKDA